MKKLYVACAITNLPEEQKVSFMNVISELKIFLRNHFEVLDFVGDAAGEPQHIYQFDIGECVEKADCVLAICDYPSTGLGYEMATAIEKRGIPVLAVAQKDSRVTRLIIGITGKRFHFARYTDAKEIASLALSFLGEKGTL